MNAPRFAEVPDGWKHPFGPYRQAPPEQGGQWWLVNPFTTEAPWLLDVEIPKEVLPEGFVDIFGARPWPEDFRTVSNPSLMYRSARNHWEQDLRFFKRAGVPEWMVASELDAAQLVYRHWGLGEARFYEGRYGWMARFPESLVRDFETSAWGSVRTTHLLVARYQIRILEQGIIPAQRHPFVPPHLWPNEDETSTASELEVS